MTLYFVERKDDGTISLFDVKMENRAALWAEKPKAKEISRKEYNALLEWFNSDEYKSKFIKR